LPNPFSIPFPISGAVAPPLALLPLGLSTAGEASGALPFGLSMADLQQWTLVYLGLSSLAFVAVWVVGYLRRR
jgi:hypothetical protein